MAGFSESAGIHVLQADITLLKVDAIVNAANERMLGGGGVDGAIHDAAGPELRRACKQVPEILPGVRCPTGEARITPAFALPARYVIHTVGPVWRGGTHHEPRLLANCYRNSLALAQEHQLQSIAYPAISCGVFGYPVQEAARVAVNELHQYLHTDSHITQIFLVAFEATFAEVFQAELDGA